MTRMWTAFADGDLYPEHADTRETCVELPAIFDDEPTQPGIVEAYKPRNNPTNDNEITRVEIPAIESEMMR